MKNPGARSRSLRWVARRLMILMAVAIPIGSWQTLALEFGFNFLAFFTLVFVLTALVPPPPPSPLPPLGGGSALRVSKALPPVTGPSAPSSHPDREKKTDEAREDGLNQRPSTAFL